MRHKKQTHHDLQHGGARRGKPDLKERHRPETAHEIGDRHADPEGTDDSLQHDEARLSEPVVIADEDKEDRCQDAVDGIGFQIIRACQHNFRILREDGTQKVSADKCQQSHKHADGEGGQDAIAQSLCGAVVSPGPDILRGEGCDGLHEGAWHQHDEGTHFLCDANTGGRYQAQRIDNRLNDHKGETDQKVRHCERETECCDRLPYLPVYMDQFP